VSTKGLAKFLAVGYGAPNIHQQQPDEFTLFIFWPSHVPGKQLATTTTEQTIKSCFHDGKLSNEAVKHYAKSELYLTNDVELFDIQLWTCTKFLDLLTHSKGIPCDGYRRGYSIFLGNKGQIHDLCRADKLFCIKFGYFLDHVFQSFIMDLMGHLGSANPLIHEARCQLDRKQEEMVNDGLQGIAFGLVPQIHLPASLSKPASVAFERLPVSLMGGSTVSSSVPISLVRGSSVSSSGEIRRDSGGWSTLALFLIITDPEPFRGGMIYFPSSVLLITKSISSSFC
jgi:hypothetical protein